MEHDPNFGGVAVVDDLGGWTAGRGPVSFPLFQVFGGVEHRQAGVAPMLLERGDFVWAGSADCPSSVEHRNFDKRVGRFYRLDDQQEHNRSGASESKNP